MRKFNKNNAELNIKIQQNKNIYIKRIGISLACLILVCVIILFTFAKFETSSEEYTLINGVVKNTSCDFESGHEWNFGYTGSVQNFETPCDGMYILEVWGAQGGKSNNTRGGGIYDGGKGGYSVGNVNLLKNDDLFVYVGGKGSDYSTTSSTVSGGFNGGGSGINGSHDDEYGYAGAGGGASDIRVNTDSLYSRIIVAGGGGAASSYYAVNNDGNYGAGGGVEGIMCMGSTHSASVRYVGGTQTVGGTACWWNNNWQRSENGSFGQGGNGISTRYSSTSYYSSNAGGGGGWYGGGSGQLNGGSGGSGWVYTASTYNVWITSTEGKSGNWLLNSNYYLENASTNNGNTTFKSPTGEDETGHTGNGYARITYLGTRNITFDSNGGSVSPTVKNIVPGSAVGELPTPTKNGKTFLGWYTSNEYTTKVDSSYVPDGDITLYALWGTEIDLNIANRTRGYPSNTGADYDVKRSYTMNTYVVGLAYNNKYSPSSVASFSLTPTVYYVKQSWGYGIGLPLQLSVGNYMVTGSITTTAPNPMVSVLKYASDGTYSGGTGNSENKISYTGNTEIDYIFAIETGVSYEVLVITGNNSGTEVTVNNLKLYKLE